MEKDLSPIILLNAVKLKKILNQHLTQDISCIAYLFITFSLINNEGAILGKVGEYTEEKSLGAIMINVWDDYLEIGKEVLKQKDMFYILLNTTNSIIVARKLSNIVLFIKAKKEVTIGMLKTKTDILHDILKDDFDKLQVANKSDSEEKKEGY